MLNHFIKIGAMINYDDSYGSTMNSASSMINYLSCSLTPLHTVTNLDIAIELINNGAKINIISHIHNGSYITPIMNISNIKIVELLLNHGAIIPKLWYITSENNNNNN